VSPETDPALYRHWVGLWIGEERIVLGQLIINAGKTNLKTPSTQSNF